MVGCSCPEPDTTGCSNCNYVRFRHNLVCVGRSKDSPQMRRLCQFGPRDDCGFCSILTKAFIRHLEASARDDLLTPVREGWQYQNLDAQFVFSEGRIPRESNKSSKHETSSNYQVINHSENTFLEVRFVEQIIGDSGGESPLGSAFFHVGYVTTPPFSSIRPKVSQSVDWSIVNKWIQECEQSHSDSCHGSSVSKGLGRPARVIDVRRNCVVHLPPLHAYTTLSYVWGYAAISKGILTAKKSNFSSLQESGALAELELPKTIRDAMEVCRQMGHQYLWVDSLCIIQDDPNDVREQISLMSDIYLGSFVTIIAAGGGHADAGLPGVLDSNTRDPQQVATFDGLEMIEILPLLGDVIQHSNWMSRAWTTALYNEDAWVMKSGNSNNAPEKLDTDYGRLPSEEPKPPSLPWPRFRDLLEDYTQRHLSYSNDIFNACTGLYHYVYGTKAKRLIFGMPETDFFYALRWHTYHFAARIPESPEFVIPSWSWASIKGHIQWMRGDGWKSGESSTEGPVTVPLVRFEVCLGKAQAWIVLECSRPSGNKAGGDRETEFPVPIARHIPSAGRIRFRTQSAMLRLHGEIGYFEMKKEKEYLQLEIGLGKGDKISTIDVAFDWALKYAEQRCTSRCMRPDHRIYPSNTREAIRKMYDAGWNQCRHYIEKRRFKFVLISGINIPPHWTISTLEQYIEGKDMSVKDEVDSCIEALEPSNFYRTAGDGKDLHIMLIEENAEKDAARRVGIANVRLDDWIKCGPVMEDVVLE